MQAIASDCRVGHGRFIASNAVTSWFGRHSASWAVASLVITLAGTALTIGFLATPYSRQPDVRDGLLSTLFTVVPYGLAGSVLISRRPDLPFGWLLSGAAAGLTLSLATIGPARIAMEHGYYGPWAIWGLSFSSLAFLPIGVQGLINVRFPSGKPSSRFERVLDRLLVIGLALVVIGGFFTSAGLRDMVPAGAPSDLRMPLIGGTWVDSAASWLIFSAPILVLLGLIAGLGVVVRCWRATGIERQQLKWRAAGVVVALAFFPLAVTERLGIVADCLDASLFVATLVIPVLRYRLWDIDIIIRRSAIYTGVTVVLIAVYAVIIAVSANIASEQVGAGVAASGVALAIVPVHNVSQRLVDRMFYGQRSDPYRALSDVGQRLNAASGEVLPAVVSAVAASLRLPYVAIERDGLTLAAAGDAGLATSPGLEHWELVYEALPVGELAAAPRSGEPVFDDRDRKVLTDIARQAGAAVRAEALTADLLESRQRLVTAREEERRRLRRDLHDGLGPMLTGLGLNLDAARARLQAALQTDIRDDAELTRIQLNQAGEFLGHAKEASAQVISDLRGMVYDLRPPALDDLGLPGALRLHIDKVAAGAGLSVSLTAEDLPPLTAAVEVAVFRTAVEAVTNAVRHGCARRCAVSLVTSPGPVLVLEVSDDGASRGLWRPGVGLTAMRERAEELGGTLVAQPSANGGIVVARYPLAGGATILAAEEFSGVQR